MTKPQWHFSQVVSEKPQGQVWLVTTSSHRTGFFKFSTPTQWPYSGPLIANEWIARTLAQRLGFPAAALELAQVNGPGGIQSGLVSRAAPAAERLTWHQAPDKVRTAPPQHLRHFARLRQLIVFDAWTVNIDRAAGKNLVLFRNNPDEPYDWYLIDHGLTLYGAPYKWAAHAWNTPYWDMLWRHYHVPYGLLRWQSEWRALEPMVAQIESWTPQDIGDAVASAPAGSLAPDLADFTTALLLRRQHRLRALLQRWLAYPGTREFHGHEMDPPQA